MSDHFWSNKRVFVTGATGLVGYWLVRRLAAQGSHVVALVRDPDPQSEFYRSGLVAQVAVVQGQVEDFATLERAISEHEIDTVIHLAAQALVGVGYRSPLLTFEANIRGTYNLLEACRVHRALVARVVVASSDKAYGTQPELPYLETMPLQGTQPYEVSKSCADLIAHTYHVTYGLPVGTARCGNIYGGGDLNWSRIIPDTIRSCWQGVPVILRSNGTMVRDYIYVEDVVRAYLTLAEALDRPEVQGEAFNFSPSRPNSVLEIVQQVCQMMDCAHLKPDIRNTAQGEIQVQYLDSTKARTLLGWEPQFSLEAGLKETIAWYTTYLTDKAALKAGC